jgi:hypothetical protein
LLPEDRDDPPEGQRRAGDLGQGARGVHPPETAQPIEEERGARPREPGPEEAAELPDAGGAEAGEEAEDEVPHRRPAGDEGREDDRQADGVPGVEPPSACEGADVPVVGFALGSGEVVAQVDVVVVIEAVGHHEVVAGIP